MSGPPVEGGVLRVRGAEHADGNAVTRQPLGAGRADGMAGIGIAMPDGRTPGIVPFKHLDHALGEPAVRDDDAMRHATRIEAAAPAGAQLHRMVDELVVVRRAIDAESVALCARPARAGPAGARSSRSPRRAFTTSRAASSPQS